MNKEDNASYGLAFVKFFGQTYMSYPRQLSIHHSPPSSCNLRSTEVVRRFPTTTFALPLPSPDCWKVERLKGFSNFELSRIFFMHPFEGPGFDAWQN